VGTDPSGNIYFCGEFIDSCRFDNNFLTGDSLLDIFVTKIVGNTTGISDITAKDLFSVYPNPFADYLSIDIKEEGDQTIMITDALGKLCMIQNFNGSKLLIHAGQLSDGIYFLTVVKDHFVSRKKIIVSR
jgi:hypothetical protein